MRAAVVCVVFAMVLAVGTTALAAPTVTIETDVGTYESGETIEVSLSAENDDEAMSVDVYIGILLPDGGIWSAQYNGWSHSIEAWIPGIYVPASFEMESTTFWTFDLPCGAPPIGAAGDYAFAAVLMRPGTSDWICNATLAPFTYSSAGHSSEITMISIPVGSFLMGSPSGEEGRDEREGPQRTVNISAFEMSETEITQRQWEEVMDWNESRFSGDDHPIEMVTWFDCVSFCNKLSELDGYGQCYAIANAEYDGNHIVGADVTCNFNANGYRLPTEAEWEYACRAGTATRYYWGDSSAESVIKQYCWYDKNSEDGYWTDPHAEVGGTQSVGQKLPNSLGLYDMSGNVWEWCWNWHSFDYYESRPDPDADPIGPSTGSDRIGRGGGWYNSDEACRSAYRTGDRPSAHDGFDAGFRICRREGYRPSPEITMIPIPGGSFLMGSPEDEVGRDQFEGPQRTVKISAFEMSETEITQKQFKDIMGWNDSLSNRGPDNPVEMVTWFDCVSFCNKLSESRGYSQCYTIDEMDYEDDHIISADVSCDFKADGYRLPTEAEWEYACRAGTSTRYYWGDSSEESVMKQYCWYERNADDNYWTDPHADEDGSQPVGQKLPNAFGLFDMSGNVMEWCWDRLTLYSTLPDPDSDPTGASDGEERVLRGGGWYDLFRWGPGETQYCRSAERFSFYPWEYCYSEGFRIVRRPD